MSPGGRRGRRSGGWPRGFAARRAARSGRGRDGGSTAIEAAIVAPAVVALILVAVVAGRMQTAGGTVEAAARSAARAASMARAGDMDAAAKASAADSMRQQGVHCRTSKVTVEKKKRTSQGVTWETVEVTVSCQVYLGDLIGGPDLFPKTLTGWFASVVDRYRGQ
ncbi:TadE/TadG family type IV pilus assembly protein [Kitasatospora purpeofusca]|uniref:Pilus assembly protein n=1 Tax=Kitasatospora purpeofusca TaxID=67352 RepID=A0ABZ1TVC1_9ACTN|nr:TadE/TadG family type IV pilus assembly protein [Kitasatospora purpeofusca]